MIHDPYIIIDDWKLSNVHCGNSLSKLICDVPLLSLPESTLCFAAFLHTVIG